MASEKRNIIIVGAGPVGLTLANFLVREGLRVLLLEKNRSLSEHSKAITIWPPTQQVFSELGILKEFEKKSLCYSKLTLHDADQDKPLITFPFEKMANKTPYPRLLIIPQYKTEQLLYNALKKSENIEICFNAELDAISQEKEHVVAHYSLDGQKMSCKSEFLVGCDGANSTVRDIMDINLKGKTFQIEAALADIKLKSDENFKSPRVSSTDRLQIAFKIEENIWRVIMINNKSSDMSRVNRVKHSVSALFGTVNHETIWQSRFKLHSRTAEKFAKGRVILAGDAAHLNSPVGGQGLNAGIIDILDLAPALIQSLEKKSTEPAHQYAEKRKASIKEGVNRNTRLMTMVLFYKKGRYAKTLIHILSYALKIPFLRRKFLKRMMMLE